MHPLNFGIGDKVVYPNHGVGIIEQISSRTMGSTVERFYLLRIKSSSLKVMVPFHNVASVGLRRVVKNGEIQKILEYLTDGKCESHSDWKYRFKENSDKMRTGCLMDVAAGLKSLLHWASRSRSASAKRRCWSAPVTCWSANWPWPGTGRKRKSRTNSAGYSQSQNCAFPRPPSPKPEPLLTASALANLSPAAGI